MTIKELESRTGMTRANIRFYEGEGLLAPKRLDNGYRDYSEEDARTLEKIKLLRQLQLDLDTIRKVQQGTLTLEQALFVQSTKLEGDKAVIERAAEVCRELERSGVEYGALDPQPYLQQLQPPEQPQLAPPPPRPVMPERDDTPRACWHPWQRYFARMLDITLYDTLITLTWMLLTRDQTLIRIQTNGLVNWIFGVIALAFALTLEPLWLHFWGWTPGKWAFGLKLRDADGEKLSLGQAWDRCWQVFGAGYGGNVPGYSWWRFWKCRETSLEGRDCPWDGEHGYRYTKEERRIHGGWIYGAVLAVSMAAVMLALLWSTLPPCKGPLGLPEFARNYNHCLKFVEYSGRTSIPTLDDQGQWVEREDPNVTLSGDTTVYERPEYHPNPITINGGVTAVTLRMSSKNQWVGVWGRPREPLVLLALCGSAGELNLFNIESAQMEAQRLMNRWESFEADFYGVHVSQQVEAEGYEVYDDVLWCEDENAPRHCEKTVTFSIIGTESGHFSPPDAGEDHAPD